MAQGGQTQLRVMKHIDVACAIIRQNGRILAAQRSAAMTHPLKWEFPGGKIQEGETPQQCLRRELQEELGIDVVMCRELPRITHAYPEFSITLFPFLCVITAGALTLREHAAVEWVLPQDIKHLAWTDADAAWLEQNFLHLT